jgi:hypothetical protein
VEVAVRKIAIAALTMAAAAFLYFWSGAPFRSERAVTLQADSCKESPLDSSLPDVVGPMIGSSPVWMSDSASTWLRDSAAKTLWVVLRTSEPVRIEGHRLSGASLKLTLSHDGDPPSETLVIANPAKTSVIPGGASADVMRTYSFLPSEVFYPTAGCWEFTIHIGGRESRIVHLLKATAWAGIVERDPSGFVDFVRFVTS